jgi:hypothetical protein
MATQCTHLDQFQDVAVRTPLGVRRVSGTG